MAVSTKPFCDDYKVRSPGFSPQRAQQHPAHWNISTRRWLKPELQTKDAHENPRILQKPKEADHLVRSLPAEDRPGLRSPALHPARTSLPQTRLHDRDLRRVWLHARPHLRDRLHDPKGF